MSLALDTLKDAVPLDLSFVPVTPSAVALTAAVVVRVEAVEVRQRGRSTGAAEGFRRAVGAILGGVLDAHCKAIPAPVARIRKAGTFTRLAVSARHFLAAADGMVAAGLLRHKPGIRWVVMPGCFNGYVSRWWPTTALLSLAATHGVDAEAVATGAFKRVGTERLAPADIPEPVTFKSAAVRGEGTPLPLPDNSADVEDARRSVVDLNARCAAVKVEGCPPPRFRRHLIGWPGGHGRFYAMARDAISYQHFREGERLRCITFDGKPVAEVDASASHLVILHGLAGAEMPPGDPYALPGVPREAVKAWFVETTGSGAPKPRWSNANAAKAKDAGWPDAAAVSAAMCDRYPFLRDLASLVPSGVAPDVPRKRLVPHLLAGMEAKALTLAMRVLWHERRALALPMHDGLIVPLSAAEAAAEALKTGYLTMAGEEPGVEVAWWKDDAKRTRTV